MDNVSYNVKLKNDAGPTQEVNLHHPDFPINIVENEPQEQWNDLKGIREQITQLQCDYQKEKNIIAFSPSNPDVIAIKTTEDKNQDSLSPEKDLDLKNLKAPFGISDKIKHENISSDQRAVKVPIITKTGFKRNMQIDMNDQINPLLLQQKSKKRRADTNVTAEDTPGISSTTSPYGTRNKNKAATMPDTVRKALGLRPKRNTKTLSKKLSEVEPVYDKQTYFGKVERSKELQNSKPLSGENEPNELQTSKKQVRRRSLRNKPVEHSRTENSTVFEKLSLRDNRSPKRSENIITSTDATNETIFYIDVAVDSAEHELEVSTKSIPNENESSEVHPVIDSSEVNNPQLVIDSSDMNHELMYNTHLSDTDNAANSRSSECNENMTDKIGDTNSQFQQIHNQFKNKGKSHTYPKDTFYCVICMQENQQVPPVSNSDSTAYSSKLQLKMHIYETHCKTGNTIKCVQCSKVFRSKDKDKMFIYRFLNHMEFSHAFQYCEYGDPNSKKASKYDRESKLNWGKSQKHDHLIFFCMICNDAHEMLKGIDFVNYKPYMSRAELREHIEYNHIAREKGVLKINCPLCQVSAKTNRDFAFVSQIVNRILHHLEDKHDFSYFTAKKAYCNSSNILYSDTIKESEQTLMGHVKSVPTTTDHEYPRRASAARETVDSESLGDDTPPAVSQVEAAEGYSGYPDASLKWPCVLCKEVHKTKDSLIEHLCTHKILDGSRPALSCSKCDWIGYTIGECSAEINFINHCVLVHGILSSQQGLQNPQSASHGPQSSNTEAATDSTMASNNAESQNISAATITRYNCFLCSDNSVICESFNSLADHIRQKHMVAVGNRELLNCHLCARYFASASSEDEGSTWDIMDILLLHMVKVHGIAMPQEKLLVILTCRECGHQILGQFSLDLHCTLYHSVEKASYYNDTQTNTKGNVNLGKEQEMSDIRVAALCRPRTHKCPLCSKGFYNGQVLGIHIKMVHQKIRSICCESCSMSFFSKQEMHAHAWLRHNLNLTGQELTTCSICGEQTIRKLIAAHRRKHDLQEYVCDQCGQRVIGQGM